MTTLIDTTETTQRTTHPLPDRAAMRFLLSHRLGRLMNHDPITGEPQVTPVHYLFDRDGSLLTLLPADSAHADALRHGAAEGLLSVRGEQLHSPTRCIDEVDSGGAVWHVQAQVQTQLIDDPLVVRDVLRRQISSVLADLPQQDKSDPTDRAAPGTLSRLVAVRMKLLSLHARHRTAG